jgi:hypothetical protein
MTAPQEKIVALRAYLGCIDTYREYCEHEVRQLIDKITASMIHQRLAVLASELGQQNVGEFVPGMILSSLFNIAADDGYKKRFVSEVMAELNMKAGKATLKADPDLVPEWEDSRVCI